MTGWPSVFEEAARAGERVGSFVFGAGMALMLATFVALTVILYRAGQGPAAGSDDAAPGAGVGRAGFGSARVREKPFFGVGGRVSMDEIVTGRASFAQRMIALGATVAVLGMSVTMVGAGLMFLSQGPAALAFPVFGVVFFGYYARLVLHDYAKAKRKLGRRAEREVQRHR